MLGKENKLNNYMNCTLIYLMLMIDLVVEIFILKNCTLSWRVVSSIFPFTIQNLNI